jgi:hypothetical protein
MIEFSFIRDKERIFRALDYSYPNYSLAKEIPFENTGRRNAIEVIYLNLMNCDADGCLNFYEVSLNKIAIGLTVTAPENDILYWFSGNTVFWSKFNDWYQGLNKILPPDFYCTVFDVEYKKIQLLSEIGMRTKQRVGNMIIFKQAKKHRHGSTNSGIN